MKSKVIKFSILFLAIICMGTECQKERPENTGVEDITIVFNISPEEGPVGTEFTFSAEGSKYYINGNNYTNLTYLWDFNYLGYGDMLWDTELSSNPVATYIYDTEGTYQVVLKALAAEGYKTETKTVVVTESTNTPPKAIFTIDPEDWYTTDVFDFNAMQSWDEEDEQDSLEMRWDWETDGVFDTQWELYEYSAIHAHWYDEPGEYTVTLQVKDTEEAIGSATGIANVIDFIYNVPCPDIPTVDYEGKTYNTVLILHQCWLKESLDFGTRLNFGENSSDNGQIEKYCYHNLDANCDKYGGMYQWNEMMNYTATEGAQGICPQGWHIPSFYDKSILSQSLISIGENSGKQIQHSVNNCQGICDNLGQCGFDFLLGGLSADPLATTEGISSWFWLSKETSSGNAEYLLVDYNNPGWSSPISGIEKTRQAYVRCLKDN